MFRTDVRRTPDPLVRSRVGTIAIAVFALPAALVVAQANRIVSVSSDEVLANRPSYYSIISDDGRYIVFQSEATNLVTNPDSNGGQDIFRHDRVIGTTELVSVSTSGSAASRLSVSPWVSADGRFVAFCTDASNVVSGDTNGTWDIFVRDMDLGVTTRVSVDSAGRQGNNRSDSPVLTPDGRYVFFHSLAALVSDDTNGENDVYRHDRQTGTTIRVSTTPGGAQANGGSYWPSPSADGNRVAFMSSATNLVSGDTNNWTDVFAKDIATGEVWRVNISSTGQQADNESTWPTMSGDGNIVSFCSASRGLVPGDTNNNHDAFVHDLRTRVTERVNVRTDGSQADGYTRSTTSMTFDGSRVIFASLSTSLVPGDTNGFQDIFIRDRIAGTTTRVVFGHTGDQTNDDNFVPWMTPDGRFATYTSEASNLIPSDTNFQRDIFWADLGAALSLYGASAFEVGQDTTLFVYAAESGETITFLASTRGLGDGPRVPQLGGLALDILAPIQQIGSARADSRGAASLTVRVPNAVPADFAHIQAVARRGTGGADSVKSNTHMGEVQK